MVSSLSFAFMALTGIVSILLPLLVLFSLLRRHMLSWKAVGIGILIFVVFSQLLEKLLHAYILVWNKDTAALMNNPWLFALYGASAAALFEETGRLVAFIYILKKENSWGDAVSYGLGHGGIEAILVGAIGSIQLMVFAGLINAGTFDELMGNKLSAEQADMLKKTLTDGNSWIFALGALERTVALILQIGLSLLVFHAVRRKQYMYFFYAILLHVIFDFGPALYQKGVLNIWLTEGILTVLAIPVAFGIIRSRILFDQKGEV